MPYIGTSPSNGVRRVHTYTATASQTTFTGPSNEGVTLSYVDTNYLDVFQNGVLLGSADYTSTSGTSVVLAQGASADDLIVIVVYDVFSVADTVSKTNGCTFDGAVTLAGGVSGGVVFNDDSASVDFRIESNDDANMFFLDGSANAIGIRTSTDHGGQLNVETTGQAYNVVLACTDDDANHGPLLDFKRISSSPADNDLLGEISFRGRNDNTEDITYATISSTLKDASDGTEDGNLFFNVMVAGTSRELLTVTKDSVVINQDSQDIDFRVESNGQSHLLFVDGGNDCLLINNSTRNNLGVVELLTTIGVDNAMIIKTPESGVSGTATAIKFRYSGSTSGTISYDGSSTSYATSSDYRLKENVTYDFDATTRLKQLKPARFNFITDADNTVDGFIAHEVSSIVPEAITGEKDAVDDDGNIVPQSIDQSKLVPLLVKTIQELEARIATLESK